MLREITSYNDTPAVFAVKNNYVIMLPVTVPCTFWVQIGEHCYYDESNGILRSATRIHRVTVPMEVLDRAGAYTVCFRKIIDRKPYFSELEEMRSVSFSFRPLPEKCFRMYQIADSHGNSQLACETAQAFAEKYGSIDLLVLNGDVLDSSASEESFRAFYDIITPLTRGEIPVVVSRGNHDLRGIAAEVLADYMPGENGNSYYSFRMGSLWGLVLDCGEDKPDTSKEYGGTICCHAFRERETAYLKNLIGHADEEYLADGVVHRFVFSHVPFTFIPGSPFNIENEIYSEWTSLLNESVKPQLMFSGHEHTQSVDHPGDARNMRGSNFPVAVGSYVDFQNNKYAGMGVIAEDEHVTVIFNSKDELLAVETF